MTEGIIDADIRKAETLPSEFYTDDLYFSKQMEGLGQSFQFVGHTSEFTADMTPIPHLELILNQPLLRTNHASVNLLLSNVCTHRGMLLCQEKKNGKSIQCPYHGRTFDRDGTLKHMPGFENVENFPSASDNLPSLDLKEWFGFEFTTLDSSLKLESILQPIEQRMDWWLKDLKLQ
ncbi:MAG: Rieske (2Fe-2S) protein, partial [Euryarchaeota archaeon]|nr:Rieske (2Fe-2S) protein [Euryarchaeota archaeon]